MKIENIDLSTSLHSGFWKTHKGQLQLLAVLSADEDKVLWGVFHFNGEFEFLSANKYTGFVWQVDDKEKKTYEFAKQNSNKYGDSNPIIIIPLKKETHSFSQKVIESEGKPNIFFDTIGFCSIDGSDGNYKISYSLNLKSKIEIDVLVEREFYYCKAGNTKEFELDASYFWIFNKKVFQDKTRIPLPKNCLYKEHTNFYLQLKENGDNTPFFEFGKSKIKWTSNKTCILESCINSENLDFTKVIDLQISGTSGLFCSGNHVKIFYYKESFEIELKEEHKYCDKSKEKTKEVNTHKTSIVSLQLNNDVYSKYTNEDLADNIVERKDLLSIGFLNVEKSKESLKYVRKAQPFALLPEFNNLLEKDSENEKLEYSIYTHYKIDTINSNSVVTLNSLKVKIDNGGNFNANIKIGNTTNFELQGAALILDTPNFPEVNDNGTFARFLIGAYSLEGTNKTFIDGAFEFELDEVAEYDGNPYNHNGKISFVLQDSETQTPLFLWQLTKEHLNGKKSFEIGYSIEDFSLPIKSVKPFGQDLTTNEKFLAPSSTQAIVNGYGERLQKQLVVPISEKSKENENTKSEESKENNKGRYYLCISESVNIGQDFRVDMRLIEDNPRAGKDNSTRMKAVILDSSPQFVGLVDSNFLVQKGYDDGVWVLAQKIQTNLNEGVWEIYDDNANEEGFHLILPAQTIGEEFVKEKDPNVNTNDESKIKEENSKVFPYKFGAPAILKISGDKLDKKYITPPWDLRKVWGNAGDIQPGLPLLRTEVELLYGLQADLKPKNTSVGELGARLGDLPVPINNNLAWQGTEEQVNAFYKYWVDYLNYYRAWKSRLAILETYRKNDPDAEATFIYPNMENEELKYKPRLTINFLLEISKVKKKIDEYSNNKKRERDLSSEDDYTDEYINQLKAKIEELKKDHLENLGAHLAKPMDIPLDETISIGKDEINLFDLHYRKETPIDALLRLVEEGLNGGVSYGFQDKEIYKSFLQKALTEGSTSAELSGLAFSNQGGYGRQIARFDNDLTAIKSLSAMGRVHRYAVERIGRIGVFWHKAKHVIEYERTVVPSKYEKNKQFGFLGRPVVRKIREYIEILETEKRYPDFDSHSPKDTGAVNACVFKSTIIPISNSWGRLVYKHNDPTNAIGWEVPLWYEGADETLFPKPQIFLMLEPPKDSNLEHSIANLAEPQNLVFYTGYSSGSEEITSDVSRWKPVFNVDFTDKPVFDESVLQPFNDGLKGDKRLDEPMPNAIDVLPGHGRFTFKVEPQQTPAGMANVYQPDSGLSGVLRTVSLQRNGAIEIDNRKIEENVKTLLKNTLNGANIDLNSLKSQIQTFTTPNLNFFTDLAMESSNLNFISKSIWSKVLLYSNEFLISINIQFEKFKKECINEKNQLTKAKDRILIEINSLLLAINHFDLNIVEYTSILHKALSSESEKVQKLINYKKTLLAFIEEFENSQSTDLNEFNGKLKDVIDKLKNAIEIFRSLFKKDDADEYTKVINSAFDVINTIDTKLKSIAQASATISKDLFNSLKKEINNYNPLFINIETFTNNGLKFLEKIEGEILKCNSDIKNLKDNFKDFASLLDENAVHFLTTTLSVTESSIKDIVSKILKDHVFKVILAVDQAIKGIEDNFVDVTTAKLNRLITDIDDVEKIKDIYANVSEYISLAASKYNLAITTVDAANDFADAANNVLTNYRSVWEEITAPGMGLNRKTIALVVNKIENAKDIQQQLSITPCIAKYKQFESDLNALGVRLPVTHIFNELKAPTEEWLRGKDAAMKSIIDKIQFPEALSNLGAMDFGGMFPTLPMPADFSKHVKFSQGFDKENLSAWAKAELDYSFTEEKTLFSISMATVKLFKARFVADIRGNVNADGQMSKKENGALHGDFAIVMGSSKLITFRDTKVIYQDGRFKFDLDPSRMEMDGVLKMITDVSASLNQASSSPDGENDVFQVKVLKATIEDLTKGEGQKTTEGSDKKKSGLEEVKDKTGNIEVPYGVKATFDIPAVNIGGGTTSLTNLSFGASFLLRFLNVQKRELEFVTGLGFYIGKREAPFNFTAFIFGGGGFIDAAIYYSKDAGTEIDFAMSVHGSAGLCFNIGWASGSVFVYIGMEGQYSYRKSIGSSMTFVLFAMLVGTLNIMGLISAYLVVRLALSYNGHSMIGQGYISIRIKICWCVTISVSRTFQKQFTGTQKNTESQRTSISTSLG